MNEFFIALGNFFFAVAGLITFLVESYSPGIIEMANSIAKKENIPPSEAIKKAEKKRKKRSLSVLIPWIFGMLFNGLGFLSSF